MPNVFEQNGPVLDYGNHIWIGGVHIDIISGDVSALEEDATKVIESGGGWLRFPTPEGHYSIHVSANTDVVVRYID